MSASQGREPVRVPARATHAGERDDRWSWVEPVVWTERMLAALDNGVKGGKWYSLFDKVYALATLRAAFARVKANRGAAGVYHVTIEEFARGEDASLERLSAELRQGTYRPQAILRRYIPKL